jgi:hypothetical protein
VTYYEAKERLQVEQWLAANDYLDMGDHEHYQRPSEHLILIFPNNLLPTVKHAEAYAKSKVGQFLTEEVGDKCSALTEFYEIQHWLILSARVVVDKQEPLIGRIVGMCVQTDKEQLTKAEKQAIKEEFYRQHQHEENQRALGLADQEG